MAKRKQPTITTIIDTAKKACVDEENSDKYQIELIKLTAKMDPKVLEEALVKAAVNESEGTLAVLSTAFDEKVLTSALIELAKGGDINGVIKLANSDSDGLGGPEQVLQQALAQAKRDNISEDVTDILGLAIGLELDFGENE
jgi:hypothetical protein